MTVQQLIAKLNKMPPGARVMVFNTELFTEGNYEATTVQPLKNSNAVRILSNYHEKICCEQDKEESMVCNKCGTPMIHAFRRSGRAYWRCPQCKNMEE